MKKGKATQVSQDIAEALLRLRGRFNLTQRDMADKLGVSFQQYQKYEKGKDRLSLERAVRLCELLGISLSFFMPLAANAPGFAESEQTGFSSTPALTAEEEEMLAAFRRLSKKGRAELLEVARQATKR